MTVQCSPAAVRAVKTSFRSIRYNQIFVLPLFQDIFFISTRMRCDTAYSAVISFKSETATVPLLSSGVICSFDKTTNVYTPSIVSVNKWKVAQIVNVHNTLKIDSKISDSDANLRQLNKVTVKLSLCISNIA